jgi:hypothetical protein
MSRHPSNLVEAAVALGGPKVRAALAKGKKVVTDWSGRRTFIHHEGQDHVHPCVEEIPWLVATVEESPPNRWGYRSSVLVPAEAYGDHITPVYVDDEEDEDDY